VTGTMYIQEVILPFIHMIMDKYIVLYVVARGAPRNSFHEVLFVAGQIPNSLTVALVFVALVRPHRRKL